MKSRDAGALETLQRVQRVEHISIARIEICYHGEIDSIHYLFQPFGDLHRIDEAHIGYPSASCDTTARRVEKTGAGGLRDPRR